jgi:hypothetical protein
MFPDPPEAVKWLSFGIILFLSFETNFATPILIQPHLKERESSILSLYLPTCSISCGCQQLSQLCLVESQVLGLYLSNL